MSRGSPQGSAHIPTPPPARALPQRRRLRTNTAASWRPGRGPAGRPGSDRRRSRGAGRGRGLGPRPQRRHHAHSGGVPPTQAWLRPTQIGPAHSRENLFDLPRPQAPPTPAPPGPSSPQHIPLPRGLVHLPPPPSPSPGVGETQGWRTALDVLRGPCLSMEGRTARAAGLGDLVSISLPAPSRTGRGMRGVSQPSL